MIDAARIPELYLYLTIFIYLYIFYIEKKTYLFLLCFCLLRWKLYLSLLVFRITSVSNKCLMPTSWHRVTSINRGFESTRRGNKLCFLSHIDNDLADKSRSTINYMVLQLFNTISRACGLRATRKRVRHGFARQLVDRQGVVKVDGGYFGWKCRTR